MIVEAILNMIKALITTVLGVLPDIPAFPENLNNSINVVIDTIFSSLDLLDCFVRPETLKIIIPVLLVIWNFEYIYEIVMWIIAKMKPIYQKVI